MNKVLWFMCVILALSLTASTCEEDSNNGGNTQVNDGGVHNGQNTDLPDAGSQGDDAGSEEQQVPRFTGVDILVSMDNSASMYEEQAMLANAIFELTNGLLDPVDALPVSNFADIRIAFITSDLGLSADGQPYNGQFPFEIHECMENPMGDGAQFLTFGSGNAVNLTSGVINCIEDKHCPAGWQCQNEKCVSPSGQAEVVKCPALTGVSWAESDGASASAQFATQAACLGTLGTGGCGIEQQLQSTALALNGDINPEQLSSFLVDDHLLLYLVVSDEEDCSIKDADSFFEVDEFGDSLLVNTACGNHPELLMPTAELADALRAAKGGNSNEVIFAAIVGVPTEDVCQGSGDTLGNCLSHDKMQLNPVQNEFDMVVFENACERENITHAQPGRRYVEMAQQFDQMGYIYSICGENWNPAMKQLTQMVKRQLVSN